jgi:hypothetical protein
MKKIALPLFALALAVSSSQAGTIAVGNFDISAQLPNNTPITGTISAMWGSYSSATQTFTPFFSNTQSAINTGYLDGSGAELSVVLVQSDNNIISVGTPMFVSIFNVPGGAGTSTWTSSAEQIVLSDPAWLAPAFTLTTPELFLDVTASTTAMALGQFGGDTGSFNINGGSPQVTLVPEPSTYALLSLAGLALGGYAARRRLRA